MRRPNRRALAFAAIGLLLSARAALAATGWPQVLDHPIVGDPIRIDSGAVSGKQLDSGVRAYFGLPFAAPPVGDLRWREPQPVASWQGVYLAVRKALSAFRIFGHTTSTITQSGESARIG